MLWRRTRKVMNINLPASVRSGSWWCQRTPDIVQTPKLSSCSYLQFYKTKQYDCKIVWKKTLNMITSAVLSYILSTPTLRFYVQRWKSGREREHRGGGGESWAKGSQWACFGWGVISWIGAAFSFHTYFEHVYYIPGRNELDFKMLLYRTGR